MRAQVLHPLQHRADSRERIDLGRSTDCGDFARSSIAGPGLSAAIAARRRHERFSMLPPGRLLHPLGSRKIFSAITIDQSSKIVAAERIGVWPPGHHPVRGSDVVLLIGCNPLVSLAYLEPHRVVQRLKSELARGMKLLIIDPRRNETAHFAHQLLQPLPGEDSTIVAGMIRLILERGWEDKEFIARHVAQFDELRQAVSRSADPSRSARTCQWTRSSPDRNVRHNEA
jgi:hypothetical protein